MKIYGQLYVVSAPSGAGKTSIVKELVKRVAQITVSVSHTTRTPRPGEFDGKDYFFISHPKFVSMSEEEEFLEEAEVFGAQYGTHKESVNRYLKSGIDVILEIDWQGASQILAKCPETCSIFILPPSKKALKDRLFKRKQDKQPVIDKRMSESSHTLSKAHMFDYWIVNENFEDAVSEMIAIFKSNRNRRTRIIEKDPFLIQRLQEGKPLCYN